MNEPYKPAALTGRNETRLNLRRARAVQLSMLPKPPRLEGVDIHAHYQPLEEVSGDFYDFIPVNDRELGLVIGDVSGHGVDAALLMAVAKKTIHLAARGQSSPRATMLTVCDDLLPDLPGNLFISVFYGVLNLDTSEMKFVSAGHLPPLLINRSREPRARFLGAKGMVLSAALADRMSDALIEHSVVLSAGDALLLYTDGLTEAANAAGHQFDSAGLLRAASKCEGPSAREMTDELLAALKAHVAGAPSEDDLSMVMLSLTGAASGTASKVPVPKVPPTTSTVARTNLRMPTSSLIGREKERQRLAELVAKEGAVVTITGIGGCGKTRLAQAVGLELLSTFPGGVWFSSLVEATNANEIAAAAAAAISVPLSDSRAPVEAMSAVLASRKPLLLILDNFEQVVEHAHTVLGAWQKAAPKARFLVTSHTALGLENEQELRLAPLSTPDSRSISREGAKAFAAFDAVKLFAERARDADPAFVLSDETAPQVAAICMRLEGMPLAIELAAARLKSMTLEQLRKRLTRDTGVIRVLADAPSTGDGKRTLQTAIEDTCNLLSEHEQIAFVKLSMFKRGFFLEAAQAVLDLPIETAGDAVDVVQSLLDKSLLNVNETPYGRRFGMYVPIREFGRRKRTELLKAADQDKLARRYIEYFTEYAELWSKRFFSRQCREALDRLQMDLDNILSVQDIAQAIGDVESAARAIIAAVVLLRSRGPISEEIPRLERALSALRDAITPVRCNLMGSLGAAYAMQQSIDKALVILEQSLELAKRNFPDATLARAYSNLGHSEIRGGRYAQAVEHLTLAKSIGARHCDELEIARFEMYHATALVHMRKLAEAAPILARAEQAFRKAQALPGLEISAQLRASIHDEHDQWDSADGAYQEAERLARKLGTQMPLARALLNRAATLIYRGLMDEALRCLEEAEPMARESGYLRGVSLILFQRAWILVMRGRHEEARSLAEAGLASARKNANHVDIGSSCAILGRVALAQERFQESLKYFQESREASKRVEGKDYLSSSEYHEALSLVALNRAEEARKLVSETIARISAAMPGMPEHERKHMTWDVFGLTASLAKSVAALGDLVRARGLVNQLEESLRHGMFKYRFRSDSVQVGMEVIENVKALLQRHGV